MDNPLNDKGNKKMVNTSPKNDQFNDKVEDKIEQAFDLLMECEMPFIIIIKDMDTGKVCSTGNLGNYNKGTAMMVNLLLQMAQNLAELDRKKNE